MTHLREGGHPNDTITFAYYMTDHKYTLNLFHYTIISLYIHSQLLSLPYLCLFDPEKAFDSVEHCVLLDKLLQVGIGGKAWRIIHHWYQSTSYKKEKDFLRNQKDVGMICNAQWSAM